MAVYKYDGPVMSFERCIANRWSGTTVAQSEAKAKSNLAYQFKKANGLTPKTQIKLPGKITFIS